MTLQGFSRLDRAGHIHWNGASDDDAHRTILTLLTSAGAPFFSNADAISNAVIGNLGEFVAYQLGTAEIFAIGPTLLSSTANAFQPLSRIARSEIDIVWLGFSDSPDNDWAALQEVKTTGAADLAYADNLVDDYEKLFGTDPRFTLRTRLDSMKNKLDEMARPDLAARVTSLGGPPRPGDARGIRLIPSLVYDSANDAEGKMSVIRATLISKGWSPDAVHCWTVALNQLTDRFTRLARGNQ